MNIMRLVVVAAACVLTHCGSQKKPKPCSVHENADGALVIVCPDGSSETLQATKPGGCTIETDSLGNRVLFCDDGTATLIADGASCSVAENADGSKTIECGDGTAVTVHDGADGASCSVAENADGSKTIECGDGSLATLSRCTSRSYCAGHAVVSCDDGADIVVDTGIRCSVATGDGSVACAIDPTGAIRCWGSVLGDVYVRDDRVYASMVIGSGDAWLSDFVCALSLDGTASCFFVRGDEPDIGAPAGRFLALASLGLENVCGLRPGGLVECWDTQNGVSDSLTRLNNRLREAAPFSQTAISYSILPNAEIHAWNDDQDALPPGPFVEVDRGGVHGCALRPDGSVACWPMHGSGSGAGQWDVPVWDDFTSLATGVFHSCGIRRDGTAYCWGRNDDEESTPPEGVRFQHIDAGFAYTCGITVDDEVRCWGDNLNGRADPPEGLLGGSRQPHEEIGGSQ